MPPLFEEEVGDKVERGRDKGTSAYNNHVDKTVNNYSCVLQLK